MPDLKLCLSELKNMEHFRIVKDKDGIRYISKHVFIKTGVFQNGERLCLNTSNGYLHQLSSCIHVIRETE